jgi:hypothetical protein
MQDNIKAEITAMRAQLVAICHQPDLQEDWRYQDDLRSPRLACSVTGSVCNVIRTNVLESEFPDAESPPYPYFSSFFLTDAQGRQTVKWSPMKVATPLIDVSGLDFFRRLDSDHHYFFLGEVDPFRFDSLLPPNQDNYVGVLGMRTSDCAGLESGAAGFAFLSAEPLSLIDPKLPLGFGFALVDDTGQVLFHSDKYRNNRENILVETRNDGELTASIYGHSNRDNFSVDYRGSEFRARVVSVPGVTQAPWSLIVYKDVQYAQTYDLEVITMAGMLLFLYLGLPALLGCVVYFVLRPVYVPEWLWPSESAQDLYRFQILAGVVMLVLSATLTFLRPIEESLYAAAAAGYLTLIIVVWSTLSGQPPVRRGRAHAWICRLTAPPIVGWRVLIGVLLVPAKLVLRHRRFEVARWLFPKRPYRSLYYIRAFVLLAVAAILPPLSFFRNSMRVEDYLHIRAAQLHAAMAWNSRERMIEKLDKDVPGLSQRKVRADADGKPVNRCGAIWDFYLGSYFDTKVHREKKDPYPKHSSDYLSDRFLRFAHFLHHSFNDIGAEALGVLRNPALPEDVYVAKPPPEVGGSAPPHQAPVDLPEWEWKWGGGDERLLLLLHEGADSANTCAVDWPGAPIKGDLVVSSKAPTSRVSTYSNVLTGLVVTVVLGILFRLTRRIFLFDLSEPLSISPPKLKDLLKGVGNVLVLPASRDDWSPELAGAGAPRIDIRRLAAEADWGEKPDAATLPGAGPIVVENFDWELADPNTNRQRLILMERLVAHSRQVIAVSAVDPFPFMIDHCGPETEEDAGRWATVLGAFTRINLGHQSSWTIGAPMTEELQALLQECRVQPELRRVAEDLWPSWKLYPLDGERVVSEVGERAAQYYELEWRSCTKEEHFLLTGLARDGMVNPMNPASLRQLLRRKLIVLDPQPRIMNESFRRFVRAQAGISMQEDWEAEAAGSGWGKARGSLATVLVLVGLFLLATQQQFLQTSAGVLTAAGGGVAALLKLIGVVQGRSSDG